MLLETFDLTAVDIDGVPLDALHGLSMGVGWPHRAEDWRLLLGQGRGIAALDEIGRVAGSAMWFPYTERFATIGMVITAPRLQTHGAGQWLMGRVMATLGRRRLSLNATRAAHRLYRSLGFRDEAIVHQLQGLATLPGPTAPLAQGDLLRATTPDDLPELAALDAVAFGAGRPALLADLLPRSRGTVLVRAGRVVAFALCRRFGRGHVIGPIVASSDADAVAVATPHIARHRGSFVRIDTHRSPGEFAAVVARSGLGLHDTVTTMSHGPGSQPRPRTTDGHPGPRTYALAGHALS